MAEKKQFEPSQKKREQARQKGQSLRSNLFYQSIGAVGAILGAAASFKFFCLGQANLLEYQLLGLNLEPGVAIAVGGRMLIGIIISTLGLAALLALIVQISHLGLVFRGNLLAPSGSRLDPIQGLTKVFGGLRDLWQVALKVALVSLLIFIFCRHTVWDALRPALYGMQMLSVERVFVLFEQMLAALAAVVLGLAALDYWIQRRRYLRELSMSLADLRREVRESEGDPLVKHSRRMTHEALAQQDVAERVKRAAVVVVDRV